MPISIKDKLIFIHIPKCAGTSIEHALDMNHDHLFWSKNKIAPFEVCPQHLYASELCSMISKPETYTKFTVVRHPFTRLYSEYMYNREEETIMQQRVLKQSFEEFINDVFSMKDSHRKYLFDRHLELQSDFIDMENIKIFKFEQLYKVFNFINKPNIHLLSGHIKDYSSVYTTELKDKVYQFYEKDFVRFGYKYNEL